MDPTLQDDQFLLVNKLVYFRIDQERLSRVIPFWRVDSPKESFAVHPPEQGEIIVFHFPNDPSRDFVKRVIGIPGDTVEIKKGNVFVNDLRIDEPYLKAKDGSNRPPTRLKEKEYYVLGDNRRASNDSRAWGTVPEENILGKVWIIYWPFSKVKILGN